MYGYTYAYICVYICNSKNPKYFIQFLLFPCIILYSQWCQTIILSPWVISSHGQLWDCRLLCFCDRAGRRAKQGEEAECDKDMNGNCLLKIVSRKTYIVLKIQRHEPLCCHCPPFAAHRHEEDEQTTTMPISFQLHSDVLSNKMLRAALVLMFLGGETFFLNVLLSIFS